MLMFRAALFVLISLASLPALADSYAGSYGHPDGTSLKVTTTDDVVALTFYRADGTVSSKGAGVIIGGKLYFHFKVVSKKTAGDGGSGVYALNDKSIEAKHFHLDGKKRWSGTWRKK